MPSPVPLIFLAFSLVWLQDFSQASAQMPSRGIYSDVTLPYLTLVCVRTSERTTGVIVTVVAVKIDHVFVALIVVLSARGLHQTILRWEDKLAVRRRTRCSRKQSSKVCSSSWALK